MGMFDLSLRRKRNGYQNSIIQQFPFVGWRTVASSRHRHSFSELDAEKVEIKMNVTNIVGIVGSLRKGSYNRFALKAAQALLPESATLDIVELYGIPIFDQDNELIPPPAVVEFKRRIMAADAILFATPEYNYSVPGGLKNAIDWASRPNSQSIWKNKPAAVMGVSVGSLGTARAQYHLRQILVTLNMPTVNQPEVMIGNAEQRFDQDGILTDELSRRLIEKLLVELVRLAKISRID